MKKIDGQYYIIYERDEEGGFIASVLAIFGRVVYGHLNKLIEILLLLLRNVLR